MGMFIENLRLALQSLKANKMRALLTMLGIIIGISSVIAIMTVGNSLTASFSDSMMTMGANNIQVYLDFKTREDEITEEGYVYPVTSEGASFTAEELITEEMIHEFVEAYPDEVYAISASRNVNSGRITVDKKTADVNIVGASAGYFVAENTKLLAGRTFTAEEMDEGRNLAFISNKAAGKLFGSNEEAIGQIVNIETATRDYSFTVVGVYELSDTASMSALFGGSSATNLLIPLKAANELAHAYTYTSFSVVSATGVDPDEMAGKTKAFFLNYYRNNRDLTVDAMSMASMVDVMSGLLDKLTMGISVIAGIALLVGGIGVMNIMLVSITERTREIGTRKALGAPNSSIRTQFIVEAVVICIIGGIIGIALGIGLGVLLANLMQAPATPSLSSIIGSLLFSMAIGVFFGYYPANKAAKMNPIDALRYE